MQHAEAGVELGGVKRGLDYLGSQDLEDVRLQLERLDRHRVEMELQLCEVKQGFACEDLAKDLSEVRLQLAWLDGQRTQTNLELCEVRRALDSWESQGELRDSLSSLRIEHAEFSAAVHSKLQQVEGLQAGMADMHDLNLELGGIKREVLHIKATSEHAEFCDIATMPCIREMHESIASMRALVQGIPLGTVCAELSRLRTQVEQLQLESNCGGGESSGNAFTKGPSAKEAMADMPLKLAMVGSAWESATKLASAGDARPPRRQSHLRPQSARLSSSCRDPSPIDGSKISLALRLRKSQSPVPCARNGSSASLLPTSAAYSAGDGSGGAGAAVSSCPDLEQLSRELARRTRLDAHRAETLAAVESSVGAMAERLADICKRLEEAEASLEATGRGNVAMCVRIERLQRSMEDMRSVDSTADSSRRRPHSASGAWQSLALADEPIAQGTQQLRGDFRRDRDSKS